MNNFGQKIIPDIKREDGSVFKYYFKGNAGKNYKHYKNLVTELQIIPGFRHVTVRKHSMLTFYDFKEIQHEYLNRIKS